MTESKMKNMVVLKNLPSNIVEEAYVILKPNQKFKKIIDKEQKNNNEKDNHEASSDYVVKEAEMVVSNYLSKIENNKMFKNTEVEQIQKKYNKLKKVCFIFGGIIVINIIKYFVSLYA